MNTILRNEVNRLIYNSYNIKTRYGDWLKWKLGNNGHPYPPRFNKP